MYNNATWHERYRNRYQWAVRAYNKFMQDMDPELVGSLPRSEKITVVVYGATQVGKTTLILDLLGLGTLTTDEVGTVLRGGQQLGKSATAMPIRYGRSPDDGWYIVGEGPLTAEVACERMGRFRREVEIGSISRRQVEVLDIRIPGRLFPACDERILSLSLNIIDIPGINSHNENERDLVDALARNFVSCADLVLLVGRAERLGFLNKEDLGVEALADWAAQPSRFRIVLTFSFSPKSLCDEFMTGELTCDRVRDVVIKEIKTHDYVFPEQEFRSKLFMLELGDSIEALKRNNPEYCQRIQNVTRKFRGELLNDIARSPSSYSRLYSAFQLNSVINKRIERLRQQMKEQETELGKVRSSVVDNLMAFRPDLGDAQADKIETELHKIDDQLASLSRKLQQLRVCMRRLQTYNWEDKFKFMVGSGREQVTWLKKKLQEGEQYQRQVCEKAAQWLKLEGLAPEWWDDDVPVLNYQRAPLMTIESKLDGYSIDRYWFSSSFKSDRDSVQRVLDQAANDHGGRLKSSLDEVLKYRQRTLKRNIEDMRSLWLLIDNCRRKLAELDQALAEMRENCTLNWTRMEDARKLVSHFESYVNEAFRQELQETREAARNHPNVTQRFYGLLHARMLLSEVERMYQGKEF